MQEYSGNINLSEFEIDADREYFDKVIFKNVSYLNLKKINITFTNSMFDNVTFNKCNLSGIAIYENTVFNNCSFNGCRITSSLFRGSIFKNCTFEKCNVKGLIVLEDAMIKDSSFKNCKFDDVIFLTDNFVNNKIIGKVYNSRFGGNRDNIKPFIADLSEAILDWTDCYNCDLSKTILPLDKNMKFVADLSTVAKKSMEIINNMPDGKKKEKFRIWIEGYTQPQYKDYIFNIEQEKRNWEDDYDEIAKLLGIS